MTHITAFFYLHRTTQYRETRPYIHASSGIWTRYPRSTHLTPRQRHFLIILYNMAPLFKPYRIYSAKYDKKMIMNNKEARIWKPTTMDLWKYLGKVRLGHPDSSTSDAGTGEFRNKIMEHYRVTNPLGQSGLCWPGKRTLHNDSMHHWSSEWSYFQQVSHRYSVAPTCSTRHVNNSWWWEQILWTFNVTHQDSEEGHRSLSHVSVIRFVKFQVSDIRGCVQKFPDWPPGERTANGIALCH
jgi:hypothetical protein